MTDLESNVQAYRTMAEVLVNLRKIVVRGLQRVSGDTWYHDGCPPGVYERLVERKESELAIQRLSTEYEDLIGFATFADLAEIIEFNEELARLLRNLASSTDLLCARLLELEALRSKLAQGRHLSVEEITVITNYSVNLAAALAGARRRTVPAGEAVAPAAEPAANQGGGDGFPAEDEHEDEPVEELDAPVEPITVEPTIAAESAGYRSASEIENELEPVTDAAAEILFEPVAEAPSSEAADTSDATNAAVTAPEDTVREEAPQPTTVRTEFDAIAADMENALAEGEERDVLRVLRREVIAVAEAVYRLDEDIDPPGWRRVFSNGWFSERRDDFGLEPLAEFHGLVEEFQVGRAEGLDADDLRAMLSSRRFSRMLLTLREMFLRNGV